MATTIEGYNSWLGSEITKTIKGKEELDKVVGKVEVIAPNKVGFINMKVGNDWYGLGSKSMPNFSRGQEISFDVEVTEKGFKNAKNIVVTPVGGKTEVATPVYAPKGAPQSNGGVDWDLKDRKIQQQSARNAAIEFIGILSKESAIVYKASAKEKDKVVVLEALLEHYTEKFLNDTGNVGKTANAIKASDDLAGEE